MKNTFIKKQVNLLSYLMAIILVMSLFSGTSFAGDGKGGGKGDGSGGGPEEGEVLSIVSSTVKDGQKDVALDSQIKLTISENVTHDSVRLGNEKAFSMKDKDGKPVEIKVILADSSNDAEKNNVVIELTNGLEAGQTYTLTVDSSLESKSGVKLGEAQNITISTVSETADNTDAKEEAAKKEESSKTLDPKIIALVVVVLLGIVIGINKLKKK